MGAFEYLSVLISIILALGMTRVLGGVGEMLQARSRRRVYWVHVIWIVNLFVYLVIAWWIFYRWRDQQPWNFYLFLFVLISPTVLYLASLLLFPRECDVDMAIDYKAHYYANHRAFSFFSRSLKARFAESVRWAHSLSEKARQRFATGRRENPFYALTLACSGRMKVSRHRETPRRFARYAMKKVCKAGKKCLLLLPRLW